MSNLTGINMAKASALFRFLSSLPVKISIAVVVIALLVYFNRLNGKVLTGLISTWPWLVAAFTLMLPPFVIVSYRLKVILCCQGIHVPALQAIRWTMIGAFFDLAMPSATGGDLIKAGFMAKHVGAGLRTRAVLAVAFDRVMGLLGLFLVASVVSVFGWDMLRDMPARELVVGLTLGVSLGTMLFLRVAGSRSLYRNYKFDRVLSQHRWGLRLKQVIASFNSLREHPGFLFTALGLSAINHLFWCASLFCIAMVAGHAVDPMKGLVVFPLAIFSNVFGIAGGFGVGTAGFDLLFSQLLAIGNGALIGLLFQALSALARLTGLPFYLLTQPGKG